MRCQVAIPSYQRAEMLRAKTLRELRRLRVDPGLITVFVATEQQRDHYQAALEDGSYGRIVVAAPGIGAVRRFIQRHYEPGQWVLNVDDDIDGLFDLGPAGRLRPLSDLGALCATGFGVCGATGFKLWGIYPAANHFFMKPRATLDCRFIPGGFFGCVADHDEALEVTLDDKEDYERSIQHHLAHGGVVRLEWVTMKTRNYHNPGGMQSEKTGAFEPRSKRRNDAAARFLTSKFPSLCRLNLSRSSGHTEIRLLAKNGLDPLPRAAAESMASLLPNGK